MLELAVGRNRLDLRRRGLTDEERRSSQDDNDQRTENDAGKVSQILPERSAGVHQEMLDDWTER